jgi:hypothetical protein
VLIHAVVDEPPAEGVGGPPCERLPGGVLNEEYPVADPVEFGELEDRREGLLQRLTGQGARVEIEVVLSVERDLPDPLGDLRDLGLAVEAQKPGLCVENPVTVGRERLQELLRALDAEAPVDDRQAEDVETAGGRLRKPLR